MDSSTTHGIGGGGAHGGAAAVTTNPPPAAAAAVPSGKRAPAGPSKGSAGEGGKKGARSLSSLLPKIGFRRSDSGTVGGGCVGVWARGLLCFA